MLAATCTLCLHVLHAYTCTMYTRRQPRVHHVCICVYMYYMCMYIYTCIFLDMHMHINIHIHMERVGLSVACARLIGPTCFSLVVLDTQLGSSVRLPTLFPTLVALLPTLAHSTVLVCTHWHVRVPMLCDHAASAHFAIVHGASKLGRRVCEA